MNIFKNFLKKDESVGKNESPFPTADEKAILSEFEKRFQLSFRNPSLIITALKHRSYLNVTNEDRTASNERLEFLGDAVLDLVVTHYLYQKFPKRTEGQLSKIKSILVSKPVLAEISQSLALGDFMLMNRGEEKTGGRQRKSILADCYEAVVGAIYLDMGLETATRFIHENLLSKFKSIIQRELYMNYKSALLEYAQSNVEQLPEYRVLQESGPDHDKNFVIGVFLKGKRIAEGEGKSKKYAEQQAARFAIKKLGIKSNFLKD